jgi:hypothetical protein
MSNKDLPDIYQNPAAYAAVLECVPKELRSIAVLFDETLLENWYPGVVDHRYLLLLFNSASLLLSSNNRPEYQVMQPFQLFAHCQRKNMFPAGLAAAETPRCGSLRYHHHRPINIISDSPAG